MATTQRRRWALGELWANRDFTRLWWAQTISQFGSQVSAVAIPLIAIQTLHAGPTAMGVLGALARLPFLLYLAAGIWVDRTRRRPVLISTDLARAALLLVLVVGGLTDSLSLWLLGIVVSGSMLLTVWFETAYMSYLPSIVDRSQLMAGNVRLETTRAGAQAAGPGVGGLLVQLLTAPIAVLADAVSFVFSAVLVRRIGAEEKPPEPANGQGMRGLLADLSEGLRFVAGHRLLRPLAVAIGVSNLAWAAELVLFLIFLARTIGLPAGLIGLTLASSGPGAVVGSMVAGRVRARYGESGAIIGGLTLFAAAALLIPMAPAAAAVAVPLLVVSGFAMSVGGQICAVNVLTLRQSVTPDRLLGRVNASFRFVALGLSPLGALAGGLLGSAIGLRLALFVSVAGMFVAPLVLLPTPVRTAGRGGQ
jgi:MFS family permease